MILGLTGSIASGKSSVADCLVECGAILVSADRLAREVVSPGSPALAELVKLFGLEILTSSGQLDREFLARKVFADSLARKKLENITHPAIAHLAECRLTELRRSGHELIVYEAPLLFEAGGEDRVDQVLVVVIDPVLQLERLMKRDNLSEGEARQRIAAQWPQAEKVRRADYVVDNSAPLSQTRLTVSALYDYLTSSAQPGFSSS